MLRKKYKKALVNHLLKKPSFDFILGKGLEIATGKSFYDIDPDLWKKWINKDNGISRLRNKVLHGGEEVSDKQSKTAIELVNNIMKTIIEYDK